MTDKVLRRDEEGICFLTINRPQVRNALDGETIDLFRTHLATIERDPGVRCLVLEAAGEHFVAGGDLNEMQRRIDESGDDVGLALESSTILQGNHFPEMMERMPQPVIASVRGGVAGGGLTLALGADFMIASETAFFVFAHAKLALCPDGGVPWYAARLIGERAARKLMMTGARIDAAEADRLGMLDSVVPDAELEAATLDLARRLVAMPPRSLGHIKRLVNQAARTPLPLQLQREAEAVADCAADPNFREGVQAFLERRKPKFS